MKRYQCIKNMAMQDDGRIAFTAGNLYSAIYDYTVFDKTTLAIFIDDIGEKHSVDEEFLHEYFQELLDLHVDDIPRDEADREPFTTPEPRRKLTAGWAWFIVLIITIGFFVLKAFTE